MSESVGYKRPPAATRWKKGESGNPKGRVKGQLNLKTDLLAELGEIIQIGESGKTRKITKQRALLKALTARGIKGDARSANLVLNLMMRLLEPDAAALSSDADLSADDRAIVDAFLARKIQKDPSK